MFRRLREALEAALAAATPPADLYDIAARMREALIEARAGLGQMRDALAGSEREQAALREQIATTDRRRELAAGIGDQETVTVAERYLAKHREHAAVLEKKLAAQREELALAERDVAEMTAQLEEVTKRRGGLEGERSAQAAWSALGQAGMDRPEVDPGQAALKAQLDRAAREAEADAKLEELKRRMGKR